MSMASFGKMSCALLALASSAVSAQGETLVASAPVPRGPITLTYRSQGARLRFSYTAGRRTVMLKEGIDATLLSTQKAGGFVGTIVGPYAYYQ